MIPEPDLKQLIKNNAAIVADLRRSHARKEMQRFCFDPIELEKAVDRTLAGFERDGLNILEYYLLEITWWQERKLIWVNRWDAFSLEGTG